MTFSIDLRRVVDGQTLLPSTDPAADLFTRAAALTARLSPDDRRAWNEATLDLVASLNPSIDSPGFYFDSLRLLSITRPEGGKEVLARMLRSGELESLRVNDEPIEGIVLLALAEYGFPAWASSWGTIRLAKLAEGKTESDHTARFSLGAALCRAESLAYTPNLQDALIATLQEFDPERVIGFQRASSVLRDLLETLLVRHCAEEIFHAICEKRQEDFAKCAAIASIQKILISTLDSWDSNDHWKRAILTGLAPIAREVPSSVMTTLKRDKPNIFDRSCRSAERLAALRGVDFSQQIASAVTRMIDSNLASSAS